MFYKISAYINSRTSCIIIDSRYLDLTCFVQGSFSVKKLSIEVKPPLGTSKHYWVIPGIKLSGIHAGQNYRPLLVVNFYGIKIFFSFNKQNFCGTVVLIGKYITSKEKYKSRYLKSFCSSLDMETKIGY